MLRLKQELLTQACWNNFIKMNITVVNICPLNAGMTAKLTIVLGFMMSNIIVNIVQGSHEVLVYG